MGERNVFVILIRYLHALGVHAGAVVRHGEGDRDVSAGPLCRVTVGDGDGGAVLVDVANLDGACAHVAVAIGDGDGVGAVCRGGEGALVEAIVFLVGGEGSGLLRIEPQFPCELCKFAPRLIHRHGDGDLVLDPVAGFDAQPHLGGHAVQGFALLHLDRLRHEVPGGVGDRDGIRSRLGDGETAGERLRDGAVGQGDGDAGVAVGIHCVAVNHPLIAAGRLVHRQAGPGGVDVVRT